MDERLKLCYTRFLTGFWFAVVGVFSFHGSRFTQFVFALCGLGFAVLRLFSRDICGPAVAATHDTRTAIATTCDDHFIKIARATGVHSMHPRCVGVERCWDCLL